MYNLIMLRLIPQYLFYKNNMEKLNKVLALGFTKIEVCSILWISTATLWAIELWERCYSDWTTISDNIRYKIAEWLDFIYKDFLNKH